MDGLTESQPTVSAAFCAVPGTHCLTSNRTIPGYWENSESRVKRFHQSRTQPVPLIWLVGWLWVKQ